VSVASWLFFVAFAVIFIGVLLVIIGTMLSSGTVSGGAIILIGPIPIILGTGPNSLAMVGLAAALTVLSVVVFFLMRRRR
jgi:uncharacterized membrane protein